MLEQKQCCSCSCCFVLLFQKRKRTRQDKRRRAEKRQNKRRGSDVVAVWSILVREFLTTGCKEVLVQYVWYISMYQRSIYSNHALITMVYVLSQLQSKLQAVSSGTTLSHRINVGHFCPKHCCSKQFCPMGD